MSRGRNTDVSRFGHSLWAMLSVLLSGQTSMPIGMERSWSCLLISRVNQGYE